MTTQATLTMTLGRLFWNNARKAVEEVNFKGGDVNHSESLGFIERDFTFKGSTPYILALRDHFRKVETVNSEANTNIKPPRKKHIISSFLRCEKN